MPDTEELARLIKGLKALFFDEVIEPYLGYPPRLRKTIKGKFRRFRKVLNEIDRVEDQLGRYEALTRDMLLAWVELPGVLIVGG